MEDNIGIDKTALLLLVAPLVLLILALGWFYLIARRSQRTVLVMRGLGLSIELSREANRQEVHNVVE